MEDFYKVTFSNGDTTYLIACSVSDAIAKAEYQFGPFAIHAELYEPETEHAEEFYRSFYV